MRVNRGNSLGFRVAATWRVDRIRYAIAGPAGFCSMQSERTLQ